MKCANPWLVSSLFTPSLYAPFWNPLDFSFAYILSTPYLVIGRGDEQSSQAMAPGLVLSG